MEEACSGDPHLRREVEELLEQTDADPSFLEVPLLDVAGMEDDGVVDSKYIGPYRLIRSLGRGGMGEVFLAVHEGEDFQTTVALKVIRPGLDTADVLARFKLERQILAGLNHPNIARLLDGGSTEDGHPYLVMEYVEGVRIDEHCDRSRIGVRDRLGLFRTICSAVQHAHQNLVIHRDIKPSNVLVSESGIPKLLDFGISKITDPGAEDRGLTETGVRVLTPEFASPEQLLGRSVTTTTDVYSLGVVLFDLLTGRHPHADGKVPLPELEKSISETDPRLPSLAVRSEEETIRGERLTIEEASARRATDPSRLVRTLTGDLDNIVLKALHREPERRYVSVAALSDDVGRYLDGLPVLARPDQLLYRTAKFARRNRGGVLAAGIVLFLLAGSSALTQVQNRRIRAQSERVARERDKAEAVQGFLLEMFGAVGPEEAEGDDVSARALLNAQSAAIEQRYASDPELKAAMEYAVADGYQRLQMFDEAEELARRSLTARAELLGPTHADVAHAQNLLGWILHEQRELEQAEGYLRAAVATWRSHGLEQAGPLSKALNDLAIVVESRGQPAEAEALLREALAIRLEEFGESHRAVGITANNLGVTRANQGDRAEALEMWQLAARSLESALGPDHQRVWIVRNNLATAMMATGDLEGSEAEFRAVLDYQIRTAGLQSEAAAFAMIQLAVPIRDQAAGDPARMVESDSLVRESLAIRTALHGPSDDRVASSLGMLAGIRTLQGAHQEAAEYRQRVLGITVASLGGGHPRVAIAMRELARALNDFGEPVRTDSLQRAALGILSASLGNEHAQTVVQLAIVGRGLVERRRPAEGIPFLQRSLEAAPEVLGPNSPVIQEARVSLAEAHALLEEIETTDSLLMVIEAGPSLTSRDSSRFEMIRALVDRLRVAEPSGQP